MINEELLALLVAALSNILPPLPERMTCMGIQSRYNQRYPLLSARVSVRGVAVPGR